MDIETASGVDLVVLGPPPESDRELTTVNLGMA